MRIGIDIGGTSIKIGVVSEQYAIVEKKIIQVEKSKTASQITKEMVTVIESLKKDYDIQLLGIAAPGTIRSEDGVVLYSNNLNWENVPLKKWIGDACQIPMALANDADAAALGEVLTGAAKGCKNAILLTLGTGVGGGIILNGQIFHGAQTGGCEPGHMVIKVGGRKCTCGRLGCLEAYASATALIRDAKEAILTDTNSRIFELAHGNLEDINAKVIFDAKYLGDKTAQEIIEKYEHNLAEGIANLVNIFRPEIVILGGGISNQKEKLTEDLEQLIGEKCFGGSYGMVPEIVTSELGNDAGIIGAAFLIS